jgi:hypothetical protein
MFMLFFCCCFVVYRNGHFPVDRHSVHAVLGSGAICASISEGSGQKRTERVARHIPVVVLVCISVNFYVHVYHTIHVPL